MTILSPREEILFGIAVYDRARVNSMLTRGYRDCSEDPSISLMKEFEEGIKRLQRERRRSEPHIKQKLGLIEKLNKEVNEYVNKEEYDS